MAELISKISSDIGICHAVISPGSRSTPLVFAFSENRNIKCHSVLDERSAAFFATGLARSTESPVALICTSGTAVAEYLPALIEASYQKIPLLLITADRPLRLLGVGANQTIKQRFMFQQYASISYCFEAEDAESNNLPDKLLKLRSGLLQMKKLQSPVHINMAFDKPLEPFTPTGKVYHTDKLLRALQMQEVLITFEQKKQSIKRLLKGETAILSLGPFIGKKAIQKQLISLAEAYNIPILADTASGVSLADSPNVIGNFPLFINDLSLDALRSIKTVIHHGLFHTSSSAEKLFKELNPVFVNISISEEYLNPLALPSQHFLECEHTVSVIEKFFAKVDQQSTTRLLQQLQNASHIALDVIKSKRSAIKPLLYSSLGNVLTESSFIFIGNSLAIREMNSFWATNHTIQVFHNRGASGIDGLIATAAGIATEKKPQGVAILGDLSFFYDLTSLQLIALNKLNLKIIVMNNRGGGIFYSLPIAKSENQKVFTEHFIAEQSLSIAKLTAAFGINHFKCTSVKTLKTSLTKLFSTKLPSVLEISCNYKQDKADTEEIKAIISNKLSTV